MKFFFVLFLLISISTVYAAELQFSLYNHNGEENGCTLLVIGGVHGDEPGSYFAASLLATNYKVRKGKLWIVPNLNFDSIIADRRGIYGDMNRKFASIAEDDPDYEPVKRIKELILKEQVYLVINLHDGYGFYRDKWESAIFNPRAWGQSYVIDQETIDDTMFGNLDEITGKVAKSLNENLKEDHHYFSVKNTETQFKDEEMQRSLTFFAVTHLKPAIAIEISKNLENLAQNVNYHLHSIEQFMDIMKIEYERDFELTETDIERVLSEPGELYINDIITLHMKNPRKTLRFIPMQRGENRFSFDHPLGAVIKQSDRYSLYIGNNHVCTLYPQYFTLECDSPEFVQFIVDGKEKNVKFGETFDVQDCFMINSDKSLRVNVIGFVTPGRMSQDRIMISRKDIMPRFSQDIHGKIFRIEFYLNGNFCGMINARF